MSEQDDMSNEARTSISLYEFYALGIERLLKHAPWELERAVSPYHESFLTEQRCLGLAILLLLGEDHVPKGAIQSMPDYEHQARVSVNQAVFRRALGHYFEASKLSPARADMVLKRMQSYVTDSRGASERQESPLVAMLATMSRRVPPHGDKQEQQYAARVEKMYDYIDSLVQKNLLQRYRVTS